MSIIATSKRTKNSIQRSLAPINGRLYYNVIFSDGTSELQPIKNQYSDPLCGANPTLVKVYATGTRAIVLSELTRDAKIINLEENTVVANIDIGYANLKEIQVNSTETMATIVSNNGNKSKVTVIDLSQNKQIFEADVTKTSSFLDKVTITPDGTKVIANGGTNASWSQYTDILSITDKKLISSVYTAGLNRDVKVIDNTKALMIAGNDSYILTLSSGAKSSAIACGTTPNIISILPNGTRAFVANSTGFTSINLTNNSPTSINTGKSGTAKKILSSPTNDKVYILNFDNTITAITVSNNSYTTLSFTNVNDFDVSTDGAKLFIARSGATTILSVDSSSYSIAQTYEIGMASNFISSSISNIVATTSSFNSIHKITISNGSLYKSNPYFDVSSTGAFISMVSPDKNAAFATFGNSYGALLKLNVTSNPLIIATNNCEFSPSCKLAALSSGEIIDIETFSTLANIGTGMKLFTDDGKIVKQNGTTFTIISSVDFSTINTFSVSSGVFSFCINNNKIYVAHGTTSISVINILTGTTSTITIASAGYYIKSSQLNRVILGIGGTSVAVINTLTDVATTVSVNKSNPSIIGISPNGERAIIAPGGTTGSNFDILNLTNNSVTTCQYSPQTNSLEGANPILSANAAQVLNDNSTIIWSNKKGRAAVAKISGTSLNDSTYTATGRGDDASSVQFAPDGKCVISYRTSNRIDILDYTTLNVTNTLSTGGTNSNPGIVKFTSDGTRGVVLNVGNSSLSVSPSLLVVNTSNWSSAGAISLSPYGMSGSLLLEIASNASYKKAIVLQSGSGSPYLFDIGAATPSVIGPLYIINSSSPSNVSVSNDGSTAIITSSKGFSIFNMSTNSKIKDEIMTDVDSWAFPKKSLISSDCTKAYIFSVGSASGNYRSSVVRCYDLVNKVFIGNPIYFGDGDDFEGIEISPNNKKIILKSTLYLGQSIIIIDTDTMTFRRIRCDFLYGTKIKFSADSSKAYLMYPGESFQVVDLNNYIVNSVVIWGSTFSPNNRDLFDLRDGKFIVANSTGASFSRVGKFSSKIMETAVPNSGYTSTNTFSKIF